MIGCLACRVSGGHGGGLGIFWLCTFDVGAHSSLVSTILSSCRGEQRTLGERCVPRGQCWVCGNENKSRKCGDTH